MKRFSFSSLDSFDKCPQLFKYRYIERLKPTILENVNLIFGDAIHQSFYFAFTEKPVYPDVQEVLARFENIFSNKIKNREDRDNLVGYIPKGKKIINEFFKKYNRSDFQVIDLERGFSVPFDDFDITGKIDRIDKVGEKTFEIIDYKTGKIASMDELKSSLQLAIYQIAVNRMWSPDKVISSFIYLEHGPYKLDISFNKNQLDDFKNKIIEKVSIIRKEEKFKAFPSGLCFYCDYQNICEYSKTRRKKDSPEDELINSLIDNLYQSRELKNVRGNIQKNIKDLITQNNLKKIENAKAIIALSEEGKLSIKFKENPDISLLK